MREIVAFYFYPACWLTAVIGAAWLAFGCLSELFHLIRSHR